jgi:hypothetical protein
MSPVLVVLLALACAVLVVVPVVIVKRLGRTVLAEVLRNHPEHSISRIDPMANLFGVQSRGKHRIRGNGVLLATPGELYFRMLAPRKEITIPFRDLTGFGTEKGFLGKSVCAPLLRVDYRSVEGPESAAWAVRDLDGWLSTLASAMGGSSQREV